MPNKFYGVGFRIDCGHSSHPRAYSIWQGILKRCYDEKHIRYNVYGGKGIRISKRWFCFDTFVSDLSSIEGWNKNLFDSGCLQLDKDLKQRDKEVKIYSRKTCTWVSKRKNNQLQPSQMRKFKAISPNGSKYRGLNKAKFCRIHGLSPVQVSKCLNGRIQTHKGWTFEYI